MKLQLDEVVENPVSRFLITTAHSLWALAIPVGVFNQLLSCIFLGHNHGKTSKVTCVDIRVDLYKATDGNHSHVK